MNVKFVVYFLMGLIGFYGFCILGGMIFPEVRDNCVDWTFESGVYLDGMVDFMVLGYYSVVICGFVGYMWLLVRMCYNEQEEY